MHNGQSKQEYSDPVKNLEQFSALILPFSLHQSSTYKIHSRHKSLAVLRIIDPRQTKEDGGQYHQGNVRPHCDPQEIVLIVLHHVLIVVVGVIVVVRAPRVVCDWDRGCAKTILESVDAENVIYHAHVDHREGCDCLFRNVSNSSAG